MENKWAELTESLREDSSWDYGAETPE